MSIGTKVALQLTFHSIVRGAMLSARAKYLLKSPPESASLSQQRRNYISGVQTAFEYGILALPKVFILTLLLFIT